MSGVENLKITIIDDSNLGPDVVRLLASQVLAVCGKCPLLENGVNGLNCRALGQRGLMRAVNLDVCKRINPEGKVVTVAPGREPVYSERRNGIEPIELVIDAQKGTWKPGDIVSSIFFDIPAK